MNMDSQHHMVYRSQNASLGLKKSEAELKIFFDLHLGMGKAGEGST